MTWINRIQEGIVLTLGDGIIYKPLYMILDKTIEYNVSEFDFPNIHGTLVSRQFSRGAKYKLEIIFQGADHLEVMKRFEKSARDKRPWIIEHPFYDIITVQPLSLNFDPSGLNTTRITGDVMETLTEDAPRMTRDSRDKTNFDSTTLNQTIIDSFSSVNLTPQDGNDLADNVDSIFSSGDSAIKSPEQSEDYLNIFSVASSFIDNNISNAGMVANLTLQLINYPHQFISPVRSRLRLFINQLQLIEEKVNNFSLPNSKKIYEMNGSALVNGAVMSAINPIEGDYNNVNDVMFSIDLVNTVYNNYVVTLDSLQTNTGFGEDSYIPNFQSLNELSSLVDFALSQLFQIVLTVGSERVVFLGEDSTPILLAHRFYGLDVEDTTIDRFISENNIGSTEFFIIKKGRRVVYYS
tara:strand:+ start:7575 stop:8798 length:1224 start_codon:yes stop_codon:yes gene_type:complete